MASETAGESIKSGRGSKLISQRWCIALGIMYSFLGALYFFGDALFPRRTAHHSPDDVIYRLLAGATWAVLAIAWFYRAGKTEPASTASQLKASRG